MKHERHKICVVTGTRAEYGLLKPLLDEIKRDKDLELQLIVTGSHHVKELGLTKREIDRDGFQYITLKILPSSGKNINPSVAMGNVFRKYPEVQKRLKSDILVLLGDRYEMLAFAASATVQNIPIAHIHGGELTEGSFDDSFRHAITKMSHLHFTSTEEYRRRVIQLGEQPDRVFNVGAIGLDNIKKMKLLSKEVLEREIGFKFKRRNLLVTFHPVTLEANSDAQFQALLDELNELHDTGIIFTKANADPGGEVMNRMIDDYVEKHHDTTIVIASMGQLNYLSAMKYVDAVVGNSSSGIIEAPSFHIATINISDRQKGRLRRERPESIIDCEPTVKGIRAALRKVHDPVFQEILKNVKNPYEGKNTAKKIKENLKTVDLFNILKKEFYDIPIKKKESSQ